MSTNVISKSYKNKGFLGFIGLAIFLILPIILAHFTYNYLHVAGGKTNQGTLLEQPNNIKSLALNTTIPQSLITYITPWKENSWTIIYAIPKNCDETCLNTIYKLQQVHIAVGKNVNRLQRVNLYTSNNLIKDQAIYQKFPHLTIATILQPRPDIINPEYIYLADPLGNLILSYKISDTDFDKKILKDTKKLLNISRIG